MADRLFMGEGTLGRIQHGVLSIMLYSKYRNHFISKSIDHHADRSLADLRLIMIDQTGYMPCHLGDDLQITGLALFSPQGLLQTSSMRRDSRLQGNPEVQFLE